VAAADVLAAEMQNVFSIVEPEVISPIDLASVSPSPEWIAPLSPERLPLSLPLPEQSPILSLANTPISASPEPLPLSPPLPQQSPIPPTVDPWPYLQSLAHILSVDQQIPIEVISLRDFTAMCLTARTIGRQTKPKKKAKQRKVQRRATINPQQTPPQQTPPQQTPPQQTPPRRRQSIHRAKSKLRAKIKSSKKPEPQSLWSIEEYEDEPNRFRVFFNRRLIFGIKICGFEEKVAKHRDRRTCSFGCVNEDGEHQWLSGRE